MTIVNVCEDCRAAVMDDDFESMGEGKEALVRDGLSRTGWLRFHAAKGVCATPCGCCGETLEGNRFRMLGV
jgi:hypothetical protein